MMDVIHLPLAATTATQGYATSRARGLAEAYAEEDDDDDTVSLVVYPDMDDDCTTSVLPATTGAPTPPPTAEPTTAEPQQIDAGATPAEDSSMPVGAAPHAANGKSLQMPTPDVASTEESASPPTQEPPLAPTATPAEADDLPHTTQAPADTATNAQSPPPQTAAASSDLDSVRSEFSSPPRQDTYEAESPLSELSDMGEVDEYDYDYDESSGHRLIRLKPTAAQWEDFPALLAFARKLGAREDGCFKLQLPEELRQPLPPKEKQVLSANAYRAKQVRKTTFWQLSTVKSEGEFYTPSNPDAEPTESLEATFKTLKTLFRKNAGRQMRAVRYRPDVPAWNPEQRREAGVPVDWSPIHPLRGDMLDRTKAVIPGIHTPYVYESAPHFGATFQIHAEDYRLLSLNHLYRGRKIWIVVPCTAIDAAETALGRGADGCSQFMRHRAEFFFPEKLDKLGIPYRVVDQRPGETIVILPDAYHEGFSTGYTLAEAKNYADDEWSTETYRPCAAHCQLLTAIPPEYMRVVGEDEARLDLCALHDQAVADAKRAAEEVEAGDDYIDGGGKRVRVE